MITRVKTEGQMGHGVEYSHDLGADANGGLKIYNKHIFSGGPTQ